VGCQSNASALVSYKQMMVLIESKSLDFGKNKLLKVVNSIKIDTGVGGGDAVDASAPKTLIW